MHIQVHSDDIGQGMNLFSIEGADVATETLEDGQYSSGIVKLGISA